MNCDEKVSFQRAELEKTRRAFRDDREETRVAENLYQRAMTDAVCHGSQTVRGGDLSLTDPGFDPFLHVAFYCDGVNVMAVFSSNTELVGRPHIFTLDEAVAEGERISTTATMKGFHLAKSLCSPFRISVSS